MNSISAIAATRRLKMLVVSPGFDRRQKARTEPNGSTAVTSLSRDVRAMEPHADMHGLRDLLNLQTSKTAPSTSASWFPRRHDLSGKKRRHTQNHGNFDGLTVYTCQRHCVSGESNVFPVYGLNGAAMPQCVPFEQQTRRKRHTSSCGPKSAPFCVVDGWRQEPLVTLPVFNATALGLFSR
jgi:hypothetical protein